MQSYSLCQRVEGGGVFIAHQKYITGSAYYQNYHLKFGSIACYIAHNDEAVLNNALFHGNLLASLRLHA
jgi:hypothetical protein